MGRNNFWWITLLCILVFTRYLFNIHAKVKRVWEGHKIWNYLPHFLTFTLFCGLFRKPELYDNVQQYRNWKYFSWRCKLIKKNTHSEFVSPHSAVLSIRFFVTSAVFFAWPFQLKLLLFFKDLLAMNYKN